MAKKLMKKYLNVDSWAELVIGVLAGIGGLWLFCSAMYTILYWLGVA